MNLTPEYESELRFRGDRYPAIHALLGEIDRLRAICTQAHDQSLREGAGVELLDLLQSGWASSKTEDV